MAGPLGIDVFSQRYMTILVPVGAALGAAALLAAPVRWPALVAVLVLVALGAVSLVRRTGAQFEPDFAPVRAAALAAASAHHPDQHADRRLLPARAPPGLRPALEPRPRTRAHVRATLPDHR